MVTFGTCGSKWAKAVPYVACSIHVSMIFFNKTFMLTEIDYLQLQAIPTINNSQLAKRFYTDTWNSKNSMGLNSLTNKLSHFHKCYNTGAFLVLHCYQLQRFPSWTLCNVHYFWDETEWLTFGSYRRIDIASMIKEFFFCQSNLKLVFVSTINPLTEHSFNCCKGIV